MTGPERPLSLSNHKAERPAVERSRLDPNGYEHVQVELAGENLGVVGEGFELESVA
jgi:hypothetical protein